jgi:hypothetical protein
VVTNPEVLAELESLCKEAKAFENQHTDMIMPAELTEIQNAREDLERIASAYQQLIDEMYLCWNRIAIFDPFSGEFDIVDPVGYSYRIKYSVQAPVASVDTTLGKPGELAVMLSFPLAKVTVTNTTPGKQAPGPNELGSLILLYPDGQLSQARASVDDGSSDYFTSDTSGLEKALHFGGSIQSKAGLRYEYRYAETHGGYDFSRAFAVGESRERFDDAFSSSYFEDEESTYIIPEGAKDLLVDTLTKNIIGVAFANYSDIYGTVGSVEKNDAVCPDNVYYLSTPDHIN